MNEPGLASRPPATLLRAVACIWIGFGVTVLGWALIYCGLGSVPEDVAAGAKKLGMAVQAFALFNVMALLLRGGIIYFLMRKLMAGRDWARIVCLVAALIEAQHDIYHSFTHVGHDNERIIATSFFLSAVHCALYGYAMILLFTRPANTWFKNEPVTD